MLPKYTVEYSVPFRKHGQTHHYSSDDPVACEEFVEELLERGFRIQAIKHEGLDLPKHDFDKMVKTAAGMLSSKRICASLGIKPEEERFRFGFAA
ncbi:MAG: helix-turn-helix domain-containing protein [Verrucomicrobiales bacterium]|nr:helix-turn-helix domain-containing protein [Verrucomicrobiales bacterium]